MTLATKVVLILIALHLLIGFGWLVYKLSPRKNENDTDLKNDERS